MKKNVGTVDMVIRLVVGVVTGVWGLMNNNWLGLIGIIPIVTALIGNCPLYTVFGIGTCKLENQ